MGIMLHQHSFLVGELNIYLLTLLEFQFSRFTMAEAGAKVAVATFISWGKQNIIGHEIKEVDNRQYVVFVWCKICRENENAIKLHPSCRGSARAAMLAYVHGTSFVTKCNVLRHLKGKAHQIAVEANQSNPEGVRVLDDDKNVPTQAKITASIENVSRDAYRKMLNTAYELALCPSMPLTHFKVLIKCMRENGVRLIQGKDDHRACKEYIHFIAEAIKERVAVILGSTSFISILSDGSQARKVKSEKELVMVRTERNGVPVYFVTSLLEMSDYGGTDATSIKKGIDDAMLNKLKLNEEVYQYSCVSSTADGASVNFGKYHGVLTQLKETRPWLLTVHCVNHRVELAVKEAFKVSHYQDVDTFYETNFSLLKNSGAIKACLKEAATAMNVSHYTLPKISGTRFVSHRKRGFQKLLHMWPVFITAYQNVLAAKKQKQETRAKVNGLLSKFMNVKQLLKVCSYLDILDKVSPLSLVFEGENLLPCEIRPSLKLTLEGLAEIVEARESGEVELDSNLRFFVIDESQDNAGQPQCTISREYPEAGNELCKPGNRKYITISTTGMKLGGAKVEVPKEGSDVASKLSTLLEERFSEFTKEGVYQNMKWIDPQYWDGNNKSYGIQQITDLSNHFETSLSRKGFDLKKALAEWKSFKIFVPEMFPTDINAFSLWKSILSSRRAEYPNLCLLTSISLSISGSNSTVERAFSVLTTMMSDRRLRSSHKLIEDRLIIEVNDKNWSKEERSEIIETALGKYLDKRRVYVRKDKRSDEPPLKKQAMSANDTEADSGTTDTESGSDADEFESSQSISSGDEAHLFEVSE